jgi:arsenate reductase-like glutaredoxin family protein
MPEYLNLRKCKILQEQGVILNPYCKEKLEELEDAKDETYYELQAMLDQAKNGQYLIAKDWHQAKVAISSALISRVVLGYANSLDEASRLETIDKRETTQQVFNYLQDPETVDRLTQLANDQADVAISFMKNTTNDGIKRMHKTAKEHKLPPHQVDKMFEESHLFSRERVSNALDFEATHAYYTGVRAGLQETDGVWKKTWFVSSAHDTDDECDDAENDGPIDLDQDFSIGVASPPAHINCNCVMSVTLHNPK